jgi:hypothetical protein
MSSRRPEWGDPTVVVCLSVPERRGHCIGLYGLQGAKQGGNVMLGV